MFATSPKTNSSGGSFARPWHFGVRGAGKAVPATDAKASMNSRSAAATSNGRRAPLQLLGRVRPAERRAVGRVAADRAAAERFAALGADLQAAGWCDTPRLMATAYAELLAREEFLTLTGGRA
jgi:hypothetical protein